MTQRELELFTELVQRINSTAEKAKQLLDAALLEYGSREDCSHPHLGKRNEKPKEEEDLILVLTED